MLMLCTTCVWWIWMVFRRNSCLVVRRNESLSSRGWWACGFVVGPFLGKPFRLMLRACFFDVVEVFATACGKHAPHRTQCVSRPLPNTPP